MKKAKILQPGEVERPFYYALSVRQPWAYAIAHLGKDRENRQWHAMPKYRGPLLIHASKGCTRREYDDAIRFMDSRGIFFSRHQCGPENNAKPLPPTFNRCQLGGIVARVNFTDMVEHDLGEHAWGRSGHCDNCNILLANPFRDRICPTPNRWQMNSSMGLVLKDREPLPFVPWKGALGFFHVDASEYDAALLNAMGGALRKIGEDPRRQVQSKLIADVTRQLGATPLRDW